MKRALAMALVVLMSLWVCEAARAQYTQMGRPSAYYGYVRYHPYGWGGWHASTVAEGYYRGQASYVRALGDYQRSRAEAAKNWQDAYAKYLENRSSEVRTYFELQKMNRDYREAELKPPTPEQAIRLSKLDLPERMGPDEVNPISGRINWPYRLRAEEFAPCRQEIDQWFAARLRTQTETGVGSQLQLEVARLTAEMEVRLKADIKQMRPMEYLAAKKFLERLAYEARFEQPAPEISTG